MALMKTVYRYLGWVTLRGLVWLLRAPITLAINLVNLWAARPLLGDSLVCSTCKEAISLVGLWECGRCRYSWYGWYWSRCEVCGDLPPFVECGRCGASTMNPLIW